ncbi:MAG TPA: histidine phosphatase family protein [Pyrinomonadaceae bacterium]|nr:histidine phosphatase family protein [Pyrinomonadaceae bacterium]
MNETLKRLSIVSFVSLMFAVSMCAQEKTIVLVRHVEKDTAPTADKKDPELADAGRERAKKLVSATKRYKFDEIYSTDFKRTRQTAEPTATKRKKVIQTYDASKQQELVDKIMASKNDKFLVIGHSNTIPQLANLIGKRMVFRDLLDTEYSVVWVIKLKNGIAEKIEILSY